MAYIYTGNSQKLLDIASTKVKMQWLLPSGPSREARWVDVFQDWEESSLELYLWRFTNKNYLFRVKP
jgi:hypothetical protein